MSDRTAPSPAPRRAGFLRYLSPWMGAYSMVGMLLLGVGPILIPVTVAAHAGGQSGATAVGLVVAAFYAGGLLAPVVGTWADRTGRQRLLFLLCLPVMGVSVLAFALVEGTLWWTLLAFVFGGVGATAGTLAGMFVVEPNPPAEWDTRISWFRLVYGAGQVLGLVIAGAAATQAELGWLVTGLLLLVGSAAAFWKLPRLKPVTPPEKSTRARQAPDAVKPIHAGRAIGPGGWLPHLGHRASLRALRAGASGRFTLMLVVWFLTMLGVQTFFNVVPLVMKQAFDVDASIASLLFLVGAAIGMFVYPASGRLAERHGPGLVFSLGLAIMFGSFIAMTIASMFGGWAGSVTGSAALVVAAIAYSFLVVAATMLLAVLSPAGQGAAMGMLNALIAAGAVVGAIVPAFVAQAFGYDSLPPLAAGVLLLAIIVFLPLSRFREQPAATSMPE